MVNVMNYQVDPKQLEIASPYKDLFPLNNAEGKNRISVLAESMRSEGFLKCYPIAVWNGVVIDGHTRLAAAKRARLGAVECTWMDFKDEDAALEFAIRAQRNRRNLTEADILRCIEALDRRKTKAEAGKEGRDIQLGQAPKGASPDEPSEAVSVPAPATKVKSSKKTAELLGISPRQVERVRTINDHGSEEIRAAVANGEMSIGAAYQQVQEARKPKPEPKETFPFTVVLSLPMEAESEEKAQSAFFAWCRKATKAEIMARVQIQKSELQEAV